MTLFNAIQLVPFRIVISGRDELPFTVLTTSLMRASITSFSNFPLEGMRDSSCKSGFQQSKVHFSDRLSCDTPSISQPIGPEVIAGTEAAIVLEAPPAAAPATGNCAK